MVPMQMGIKGAAVYEIAGNGFLIFSFSFLFSGLNIFISAAFTALSNGKLSAILSFLRTFGWITVLLLTLPNLFGVTGVWLAVPIAELLTIIAGCIRSMNSTKNRNFNKKFKK